MNSFNVIFISMLNIFFMYSFLSPVKGENLNESLVIKKYILKDGSDSYTIIPQDSIHLKKILIDLMIFSGDVIITFQKDDKNFHKYETANKIFSSININDEAPSELIFNVVAKKDSYYSIRYTKVTDDKQSELTNEIPINTNFLTTIYPFNDEGGLSTESKQLIFKKGNYESKDLFLVNFYSLNCAYKLYKQIGEDKKIIINSTDDYFAQDLIDSNDPSYSKGEFTYLLEITSVEQGSYNKKMCMIYASSTELGSHNQSFEKNILVGENVPQKAIFNKNKVKNIKYLYEIPDINNDLAIKFILNVQAVYDVNFYINKTKINSIQVSTKQQEIIKSNDYYNNCTKNKQCELIVEIQLNETNENNKDFELEVTIKSISTINKYPSYLIKNKINREYLNFKSSNYYYTDIGHMLSGEIIINYYRGKGMIFGKIVKKTNIPMENPEWKGIYEFPHKKEGTLKYVSYLKKLIFTENDTKDCDDECYLLLNVVNNVTNNKDADKENERYFGFDILIITNSLSMYALNPLIYLPLKRYAIGSISKNKTSPDYRRYYIINFPHNAQKVIFDLQSENVAMYINVYFKDDPKYKDEKYPSDIYHNWEFFAKGKQQFFAITKEEILKVTEKEVEHSETISLTICLEAESNDNDLSTIYALNYRFVLLNQKLNIYEIYSDQQTFCQTDKMDDKNKFYCLYLVKYNKNDIKYNILLYPVLENKSSDFQVYAKFIKRDIYDLYKEDELKKYIPDRDAEFSTEKFKEKFLYINLNNNTDNYLFIKIETDTNTAIRLLSTFSTFDYTSVPNPSTAQLYIIKNQEMRHDFIYKEDILINLESISGEGEIYWQDEKTKNIIYLLRGRDDRLSLASIPEMKGPDYTYNSLIIKNRKISSRNTSQIPGAFIFYMTFYLRTTKINFDKLEFGKSFNLNYRRTSFPLSLYYKIDNIQKDTNAFVTIYTLDIEKRKLLEEKEFNVYATILSDNSIYKIRSNPKLDIKIDESIPGIYDPSKRVCLISLKSINLKKYEIPENESPNLVIKISKNLNTKNNEIYEHISIEGTVIQDDSYIPVTEKVYQHGKLKKDTNKIIYKLSTIEGQNIMYIIFSSNSDLLDFTISMNEDKDKIIEEFNTNRHVSEGRIITFFNPKPDQNKYINLTIFLKDNKQNQEEILTNYAFKYINTDNDSKIKLYKLNNNNTVHIKDGNSNHLIQVEYINCQNCIVTYYVNFILNSTLIQGEKFDNIAVIQSEGIIKEFEKNKNLIINNNNNTVNLEINDINENKIFSIIQVIAHINEGSINEYIAYKSLIINTEEKEQKNDPQKNTEENNNNSDNNTLKIVFIILGCFFIGVVVVLAIVITQFVKRNKDLLNKVNTISFKADNDDEESNNDLLIN